MYLCQIISICLIKTKQHYPAHPQLVYYSDHSTLFLHTIKMVILFWHQKRPVFFGVEGASANSRVSENAHHDYAMKLSTFG